MRAYPILKITDSAVFCWPAQKCTDCWTTINNSDIKKRLKPNDMIKLCITIGVLLCSLVTFAQPRQTYSFNAGWKLHIGDIPDAKQAVFDDKEWKEVTLPHAWNEDEAFAKPIHEHSTAVVWYRKTFTLPTDVPQDKIFLEFEGVRHGAEFYVNGTWVGRHENGVM